MKPVKKCRACGSERLLEFLDLGKQYLSDFREDDSKPPKYPLVAVFCEECKLVQLKHTTPQAEMYHDRYGFKSGINEAIKLDLDDIVTHAFQYNNDPTSWLDIASNDGYLLSCVPTDIYRVGVDPVTFLCEEAKDYANLIVNDYFKADSVDRRFDVITSISCFYDMPDPSQFVSDVVAVLEDKGLWIIQQNYLLTTVELSAVDNFCHEHIEYYTLKSLENLLSRFGLEVNEVHLSMVNGGSIRTIVSRKGTFPVDDSVEKQRQVEEDAGVGGIELYQDFAERVGVELNKLRTLLAEIKARGETSCILAASTRGATIWQSAEIDEDLVEYAVERNEAKVGKMFSAIGVPIVSEEYFESQPTNYAVIGPWFFVDGFVKRSASFLQQGGKLINPLPKVTVIGKDGEED